MSEAAPAGEDAQAIAERAVAALHADDHATRGLGIRIVAVGPGTCTTTLTVQPQHANGHGICHGGVVFHLADSAFSYACNSHGLENLAAGGVIDYLAAGRVGDVLTATATELWRGGRSGLYEIVVTNQEGRRLALYRGRSHQIGGPRPRQQEST
jgi:acyl-CoA thioesterase